MNKEQGLLILLIIVLVISLVFNFTPKDPIIIDNSDKYEEQVRRYRDSLYWEQETNNKLRISYTIIIDSLNKINTKTKKDYEIKIKNLADINIVSDDSITMFIADYLSN